jgi:hypothetical protein
MFNTGAFFFSKLIGSWLNLQGQKPQIEVVGHLYFYDTLWWIAWSEMIEQSEKCIATMINAAKLSFRK